MESSKNILVDSDFLFAYFVGTDALHRRAHVLFEKYKGARWYILTLTKGELLTTLSYKTTQREAKLAYYTVEDLGIREIFPQQLFWNLAFELFLQSTKKRTSIIDCLNLAYFKHSDLGFWAIASFDKFYGKDRLEEK